MEKFRYHSYLFCQVKENKKYLCLKNTINIIFENVSEFAIPV